MIAIIDLRVYPFIPISYWTCYYVVTLVLLCLQANSSVGLMKGTTP